MYYVCRSYDDIISCRLRRDDVREGVTDAAQAVTDSIDRMFSDGQISDGDGVISNESDDADETEDTTVTDSAD